MKTSNDSSVTVSWAPPEAEWYEMPEREPGPVVALYLVAFVDDEPQVETTITVTHGHR